MTSREYWILYFDGASKTKSSGTGLVLQISEGFKVEYALNQDFPTINNEAEYEVLLVGLGLDKALRDKNVGDKNVKIYGDSRLVVSQVNGEYEARDETMIKYLRIVRATMTHFEECTIEDIPREENMKVGALS